MDIKKGIWFLLGIILFLNMNCISANRQVDNNCLLKHFDLEIKYNEAFKYYINNDIKKSLDIINQILQINPNYLLALRLKVVILKDMEKMDDAIELLKIIISRNNTTEFNIWLYDFLMIEDRNDEAEKILKNAVEKWFDDISVKRRWMEYLDGNGMTKEAKDIAQKILNLSLTDSPEDVLAKESAERILNTKNDDQKKNN